MYKILVFDTSMNGCSVGIYEDNRLITAQHTAMLRGQAEHLVPMIEDVIHKSGISYSELDLIGCTHGPGAFTGLRVALSTAKSLSLSLNVPAIGVSTLHAMCESIPHQNKNIAVILETKRKDYYCQIFNHNGQELTLPKNQKLETVISEAQKYSAVIVGDANGRLKSETDVTFEYIDLFFPDCAAIAAIAVENFTPNTDRLQNMEPLYLREADVSFPAVKK